LFFSFKTNNWLRIYPEGFALKEEGFFLNHNALEGFIILLKKARRASFKKDGLEK